MRNDAHIYFADTMIWSLAAINIELCYDKYEWIYTIRDDYTAMDYSIGFERWRRILIYRAWKFQLNSLLYICTLYTGEYCSVPWLKFILWMDDSNAVWKVAHCVPLCHCAWSDIHDQEVVPRRLTEFNQICFGMPDFGELLR